MRWSGKTDKGTLLLNYHWPTKLHGFPVKSCPGLLSCHSPCHQGLPGPAGASGGELSAPAGPLRSWEETQRSGHPEGPRSACSEKTHTRRAGATRQGPPHQLTAPEGRAWSQDEFRGSEASPPIPGLSCLQPKGPPEALLPDASNTKCPRVVPRRILEQPPATPLQSPTNL